MKTDHTPAPWQAHTIDTINDQPAIWQVQDQTRGVIATVESVNRSDAQLVAAAPDLLAALVEYVERHEQLCDPTGLPEYDKARAAIRQATELPADQTVE